MGLPQTVAGDFRSGDGPRTDASEELALRSSGLPVLWASNLL